MKTKIINSIEVVEDNPESYPYPLWSPQEIEKLWRWYPTLGLKQCAEFWDSLTGVNRSSEQIDNKARRLGIQNYIPSDWLDLFND